ncbi:MAG: TonB family protein [Candidatus Sulfotelmatobacter sp.]
MLEVEKNEKQESKSRKSRNLPQSSESTTQPVAAQAIRREKQPRQLLVALVLLLIALVVVLGKERDFWFGSDDAIESDATIPDNAPKTSATAATPAKVNPAPAPAKVNLAPVAPVATAKIVAPEKNNVAPKVSAPAVAQSHKAEPAHKQAAQPEAPKVAAKRAVLPPLDVNVVAANSHDAAHSANDSAKVDISSASKRTATVASNLPSNAAERENIAPSTAPELHQALNAPYPLLGQNVAVKGSVVLQAVVGADGMIENLRVINGPSILAAAAKQAVRQWHFKPYMQNGQAVETKAIITVNFSIHVGDNPAQSS